MSLPFRPGANVGGDEMREIKFRQWISKNKRMEYGAGIVKSGHWQGFSSVCFNTDPIMQFTGLFDRNKKEIYEGDIIKSEGKTKNLLYSNKEVDAPWWELNEVVFENGRFMQIVCSQHNSYFGEIPSPPRDIFKSQEYKEIVGNIYENPEFRRR